MANRLECAGRQLWHKTLSVLFVAAVTTRADRPAPYRLGGFPLWALGPAGLCLGLTLSLALSRGGLPMAAGVVIGLLLLARPWDYRRREHNRRHEMLVASRYLHRSLLHDDGSRSRHVSPAR